jgi:hypothetical protein
LQLVPLHPRRPFEVSLAPEPITLDRPLAARTQFIVARSFVDDRRVRERDAGDVCRFDDDIDVAFGGNNRAPHMFGAKFIGGHE